jgi:hypothetical protein
MISGKWLFFQLIFIQDYSLFFITNSRYLTSVHFLFGLLIELLSCDILSSKAIFKHHSFGGFHGWLKFELIFTFSGGSGGTDSSWFNHNTNKFDFIKANDPNS